MPIRFNICGGCCCTYDFPAWTVYHNNVDEGNHFYTVDIGAGYYAGTDSTGCYYGLLNTTFPLQFLFKDNDGKYRTCTSVSGQYSITMDLERTNIALTGVGPLNTWIKAAKIKSLSISGIPYDSGAIPSYESLFIYDHTRPMFAFGNHFLGHHQTTGALTGISGLGQRPGITFNITPYIAARVSPGSANVITDDIISQISGVFSVNNYSGSYSGYSPLYHTNNFIYSGYFDGLYGYINTGSSIIVEDYFPSVLEHRYQTFSSGTIGLLKTFKYCLDFQPSGFLSTNLGNSGYRMTHFSDTRRFGLGNYIDKVYTYYHSGEYYDEPNCAYAPINFDDILSFFPGVQRELSPGDYCHFAPLFDQYTCDGIVFNTGIKFDTIDIQNFLRVSGLSHFDGYKFVNGWSGKALRNYVPENPILAMVMVAHSSLYYSGYLTRTLPFGIHLPCYQTTTGILDFGIWLYNNTGGSHCLYELAKADFYKAPIMGSSTSLNCIFNDPLNLLCPDNYSDIDITIDNNPVWDIYQLNIVSSDFCAP